MGLTNNLGKLSNMITSNGSSVGIGTSTLTSGIPLSVNVATSNNCNIAFQENASDKWYLRNITSSNAFSFYSVAGSAEVMRLTSAGNVGIGTSSPVANLHLLTASGNTTLYVQSTGAGSYALTSYSNVTTGYGYDVGFGGSSSIAPNSYYIYGGSSAGIKMQISGAGLVYFPTVYGNTGGGSGTVAISASGELYRATSSLKYKENVTDYNKGLNEILQLRPVYYNVKREDDNNLYAGLIAEEIEDLGLKEFVQYAEDGTPDAIYYANMIALLTKAIQELSAKVSALENKA